MRILLVEDDALIANGLLACLKHEGYAMDHVDDGLDAAEALQNANYALVILDLALPGLDGIEVLRHLRGRANQTPVLILSARGETEDRILGLDEGADDYLIKPFSVKEVLARCRALIRRAQGLSTDHIVINEVEIDSKGHQVFNRGQKIDLSPKAFALLHILAGKRGEVVSKKSLHTALYSWEDEVESNTLEVFVSRIRHQLGRDFVRTVRGVGYMIPAA